LLSHDGRTDRPVVVDPEGEHGPAALDGDRIEVILYERGVIYGGAVVEGNGLVDVVDETRVALVPTHEPNGDVRVNRHIDECFGDTSESAVVNGIELPRVAR